MHRISLCSAGLIVEIPAAFPGVAVAVPARAAGGLSVPLPISGGPHVRNR